LRRQLPTPTFGDAVLPRATDRRPYGRDVHGANRCGDFGTVFGVVIENEKLGVRFIGKSFAQLLYNPGAGRMACDVEVQNATPIMTDDKEAIQYPERDGRHGEEVHRSDGFTVIA
jgi:hypothetical protein